MTPQDLFKHYETLPQEVREIIDWFNTRKISSYHNCNLLVEKLNSVGYTCEFGLDAIPFNLSVF